MTGLGRVTAVAGGGTYGVALSVDGGVHVWGQIGSSVDGLDVRAPFRMPLSPAEQIAAGEDVACAAGRDGASCWGPYLPWISGKTTKTLGPLSFEQTEALGSLAIGMGFACSVDGAGRVHCSGEPRSLGNALRSSPEHRYEHDVIVEGLSGVTALSSLWQTCAVVNDGRVACWGRDNFQALRAQDDRQPVRASVRDDTLRARPVWIAGLTDAIQVAVAQSSTCVVTRSGRVRCWGENGYGQLGDGTTEARAEPTEVQFCANSSVAIFPTAPECVFQPS